MGTEPQLTISGVADNGLLPLGCTELHSSIVVLTYDCADFRYFIQLPVHVTSVLFAFLGLKISNMISLLAIALRLHVKIYLHSLNPFITCFGYIIIDIQTHTDIVFD